ncbi:DUF3142 domain-containing protein [Dickeya solani]|uniref:DUF3142 domain-containing protein n=1 Tax=Dickeya solani TaxID=1089444 RepID=UPI0003A7BAC5|nr:DUF3142 domain-containing protein [Dickeya solani]ANE75285.1 hypothetical protein A4U42_08030 [Dickeya solani IPO 2222]AUC42676.1 hypothetical protein D083_2327 [Dickeya solani RNS 08.23.3.1.A]AUH09301.1 hypothetical protein BJD21_13005 [Dickeya solani D s0432-1]AUH13276.1 hypothetical protein BJJ98_12970 [Dickeya solani]AYQ49828.1 hypothetical protein CTB91_04106 [Dickeya solani]
MGATAQILLVVRCTVVLTSLLCLSVTAHSATVDAARYQAFWLWAAVQPQPVLSQADTLYLHQGEIARRDGKAVFLRQGIPASALPVRHLWLSFRVSELRLGEPELRRLLQLRQRWAAAGNRVDGIQIDFDAKSHHLSHYVAFLQTLRQRLPPDCRLSVTGLLDWAKTGDVRQLNRLNGVVDELVVQTYQGRRTVENYAAYLPALMNLKLPFRLGLVQHGKWDEQWQRRLAASPFYRGEVVFLLNPIPARRSPILQQR